jgi:hypothetical protein
LRFGPPCGRSPFVGNPDCDLKAVGLLRQGDAQVFKKYSQMKREALEKLNRRVHEMPAEKAGALSDTVAVH